MWAAITRIINAEPGVFVLNAYLLSFEGLAAICVALGIVWESTGGSKEIAHRFVLWGVGAEVLFSLLLFISDEVVSGAQLLQINEQQLKIAELTERLAPRNITDIDKFARYIRYRGTKYDLSVPPFKQDGFPQLEPGSNLLGDLMAALYKNGWVLQSIDDADCKFRLTSLMAKGMFTRKAIPDDPTTPWSAIPDICVGDSTGTFGINIPYAPNMHDEAETLAGALRAGGVIDARAYGNGPVITKIDTAVHIIIGAKP